MKRFFSFVFATLVTLLLLEGASFAAAPVRITDHPANQGRPDIFGDIVVWKDLRNNNWDIFMYDLSLGVERPVSINPAYQNVPVTNGNRIIWQDNRAGATNNDIYYVNISGGQVVGGEVLLVSGPDNQGQPAVSGNTVAYVDDHSGNNDIYVIDILSGQITPVSMNSASQWQPRIDGTRIVWEDNRNGNWDIYMYDLATGIESAVSTDPGNEKVADIDGDRIVWQRSGDGASDIWMKDLGSGEVSALTSDTAYQNSPRITGDLVAWEHYDYEQANWDVYVKDLTSGVITAITYDTTEEARPAISGEKLVWEASGKNGYDIWMIHIADETAPVITAAKPLGDAENGCSQPVISASFSDNRTGIDPNTVSIQIDGADVTAGAIITNSGISYAVPEALLEGNHTVALHVGDGAGNTGSSIWEFTYDGPPHLRIALVDRFWASYDDYLVRDLSVEFLVSNASHAPVAETQVITAISTAGVSLVSPMPIAFEGMLPEGDIKIELKYRVPEGVVSFKTVVYVGFGDICGGAHIAPGPPPNL